MKIKLLKILISTALLVPFAPAAVLAESDTAKTDPAETAEMPAASNVTNDTETEGHENESFEKQNEPAETIAESESDGQDSLPPISSEPAAYGITPGGNWFVSKEGVLYLNAGNLSHCATDWLYTIRDMVKEIRVLPYKGCRKLTLPPDCSFEFWGFRNLAKIDLDSFDTSKVTNMNSMFANCTSLEDLDLSGFDTSKVTDMNSMFSHCISLKNLNFSGPDTSKVKNMASMFYNCCSLENLNLTNFDTSSVEDMSRMFYHCSSLESLNLSSFDTHNVVLMNNMFSGCTSLNALKVSNFDTSSVKGMNCMFFECSSLKRLDLSSFYTPMVENMDEMFGGCINLSALDIGGFDTSGTGKELTDLKLSECLSLNAIRFSKDFLKGNIASPCSRNAKWVQENKPMTVITWREILESRDEQSAVWWHFVGEEM